MHAFGFAAAAALLIATIAVSPALSEEAIAGAPASKPSSGKSSADKLSAEPSTPPAGKATRKIKSSKAPKSAPRIAHSFAPDLAKRHHPIQHPKLVAPAHPADFGMKWNANNDRARDVRTQTIMNRTPSSSGKVGLKLPF